MSEKKIDIKTPDGIADCRVFHPPGEGAWPAIILYMDAFGVRPALVAMAERLASNGYYVLLPNLFYRSGPYPAFDLAAIFKEGPERHRMMTLARSINNGLVARDTAAFLDFLAKESSVAGANVGCVGYCMGGGFALTAAGTYPERVAAAASFHGGRLATDQPDSPHLLAGKIRAKVYVGLAGIDPYFTESEKERLKSALETAGVRLVLEIYPEVHHGFTMSDLPVFNRDASERHWERLLQLFKDARLHAQ